MTHLPRHRLIKINQMIIDRKRIPNLVLKLNIPNHPPLLLRKKALLVQGSFYKLNANLLGT